MGVINITYPEDRVLRLKMYCVPAMAVELLVRNADRSRFGSDMEIDREYMLALIKSLWDLPEDSYISYIAWDPHTANFLVAMHHHSFMETKLFDTIPDAGLPTRIKI